MADVVAFPKPMKARAAAGDLIVGRSTLDGWWTVLVVDAVDADGFVSMVRDVDGLARAIGRVFAASTTAAPHLIAAAGTLTAEGLETLPGLAAQSLEDLKGEFRRYAAEGA